MKQENILKEPKAGNIYHLELSGDEGFVWLFRFLPYPRECSRLTGHHHCLCIDELCEVAYRSRQVGFICDDIDVKVLKPANINEIARFNREFGL